MKPAETRLSGLYNAAQWTWVRERYAEGYAMPDLEEFLGVGYWPLRRELPAGPLPRRQRRKDLPPLEERKDEFNAYLLAELAGRG